MTSGVDVQHVEILVTGLLHAGKSTLMKTISARTVYATGDLEGWHEGHLPVDESLDVHFIEPPVMPDFDFLWMRDVISDVDSAGYMVVCDSTKPELFGEMIGIVQTVLAFHPESPIVLVANKQDQPEAWTAEDIRIGLGIPDQILVVPCVAHNIGSVKDVVLQLLYQILGG